MGRSVHIDGWSLWQQGGYYLLLLITNSSPELLLVKKIFDLFSYLQQLRPAKLAAQKIYEGEILVEHRAES